MKTKPPERASMQLPRDLVHWIKRRAAEEGVPMYVVVERKFAREREQAFRNSVKRIDPLDKKAVAAWDRMVGVTKLRRST